MNWLRHELKLRFMNSRSLLCKPLHIDELQPPMRARNSCRRQFMSALHSIHATARLQFIAPCRRSATTYAPQRNSCRRQFMRALHSIHATARLQFIARLRRARLQFIAPCGRLRKKGDQSRGFDLLFINTFRPFRRRRRGLGAYPL